MSKPNDFFDVERLPEQDETLKEAARRELKRLDLARAVCSSHHTSGTAPLPAPKSEALGQVTAVH